jgi:hypothetical protein
MKCIKVKTMLVISGIPELGSEELVYKLLNEHLTKDTLNVLSYVNEPGDMITGQIKSIKDTIAEIEITNDKEYDDSHIIIMYVYCSFGYDNIEIDCTINKLIKLIPGAILEGKLI